MDILSDNDQRLDGDQRRLRSNSRSRIAIHTETYAIDEDALGTHLPKRYYFSPAFVGTVLVCSTSLLFNSLTDQTRLSA